MVGTHLVASCEEIIIPRCVGWLDSWKWHKFRLGELPWYAGWLCFGDISYWRMIEFHFLQKTNLHLFKFLSCPCCGSSQRECEPSCMFRSNEPAWWNNADSRFPKAHTHTKPCGLDNKKVKRLYTLPEMNLAPQNRWLEDFFPFGTAYFQGLC